MVVPTEKHPPVVQIAYSTERGAHVQRLSSDRSGLGLNLKVAAFFCLKPNNALKMEKNL